MTLGSVLGRTLQGGLRAQVRRALQVGGGYDIMFYSSARSAIHSFFRALASADRDLTVLVPDYVCNVVARGIGAAGRIRQTSYHLDDRLLPQEEELLRLIHESRPDALVLAPLLGSHGRALDRLLMKVMSLPDRPIVLLDAAQALRPLPCQVDAVALSFGGKDVNGFQGGALLLDRGSMAYLRPDRRPLGLKEEYLHGLYLMHRALRPPDRPRNLETIERPGFTHSGCEHFPLQIDQDVMSLASLAKAVLEMMRLDRYQDIRRHNFQVIMAALSPLPGVRLVPTESASSSSFFAVDVPLRADLIQLARMLDGMGVRLRRPYAPDHDPSASLRPTTYMVANPFHRLPGPRR